MRSSVWKFIQEPATRMEDAVTRRAFQAAMDRGDLSTIERYVAQSHVQREIRATDGVPLWCARYDDPRSANYSLFNIAAERGFADVIHWFFVLHHSLVARTLVWVLPQALKEAVRSGHVEIVDLLLSSQAFSSQSDSEQQHLLDSLISDCPWEYVCRLLITHGANVNAVDVDNIQPDQLVGYLIDEGFFVVGFEVSETADVTSQSIEISRRLLDHGATFHKSTLHKAAKKGFLDLAVLLLTRGYVDVDTKATVEHSTALVQAADSYDENSSLALVQLLLDHSANDSLPDARGRLAVHAAVERQSLEVLKLLLDHRIGTHGSEAIHDDPHLLEVALDAWMFSRMPDDFAVLTMVIEYRGCLYTRGVSIRDRLVGSEEANKLLATNEHQPCQLCKRLGQTASAALYPPPNTTSTDDLFQSLIARTLIPMEFTADYMPGGCE